MISTVEVKISFVIFRVDVSDKETNFGRTKDHNWIGSIRQGKGCFISNHPIHGETSHFDMTDKEAIRWLVVLTLFYKLPMEHALIVRVK